ncbi:glycine zipper domain-containing protein, partial [Burkholderia sp. SIMBA_024]
MNARRALFGLPLLGLAFALNAQTYGPQDEGRRFDDGSVVRCHKVEVRKNSSDPNRVTGTAVGAVVGGLLGNQVGGGK